MKILHLSVMRALTHGQRQQLAYEVAASRRLNQKIVWDTIAYHNGPLCEAFEKKIPKGFRGLFLRNLFAWIIMLRFCGKYDVIINRHLTFDPFTLIFSWFIKNRASLHHSKEKAELRLIRTGISGYLASLMESLTGRVSVSNSVAILAVTEELRLYQNRICGSKKSSFVYPNGIDINQVAIAEDERETTVVNAIFICGTFSSWHGLDLLMDAVGNCRDCHILGNLRIHLVGVLTDSQIKDIRRINREYNIIRVHGLLHAEQYRNVMSGCDIGIGSLAIFRKGLKEGATLKVRELLASGVPVFSGHRDTSIPEHFEYYKVVDVVSIDELFQYGTEVKKFSRQQVRELSVPLIDKQSKMCAIAVWLEKALGER